MRMIVTEQFGSRIFPYAQWPGSQHAHVARVYAIKISCKIQKLLCGSADGLYSSRMHGRFDLDGGPAQAAIRRQGQRVESVALAEGVGIFPARRGIGNHDGENSAARQWMQQDRDFRVVIFFCRSFLPRI